MVLVGVSKMGCTHLIFVDPGVKINGCYYREVLLSQQLLGLPAIWQVSGDFFVFQQDSASAIELSFRVVSRVTQAFMH